MTKGDHHWLALLLCGAMVVEVVVVDVCDPVVVVVVFHQKKVHFTY